jgi:hypothetical protein
VRKHSRHRPRPVLANPVALSIELAGKLPLEDQALLKRIVRQAFDGLRTGTEPGPAWRQLADALNIGEQLAALGICSDDASRERIAAGQRALASVHGRHAQICSWTLRSAELLALDEAVWIHAIQLEHCSKGEFERAHTRAKNRLQQARAGNAPHGAIICSAVTP